MLRFAVAFAVLSCASAPSFAQATSPAAPAAQQPQKQMIKKRVCKVEDADDIGSRIATRKVCRTVEEEAPKTVSREGEHGTAAKPNAD